MQSAPLIVIPIIAVTFFNLNYLMVFSDPTLRLAHVDIRVISKLQERLEGDLDALKRVLQSFGISKNLFHWKNFSSIFQLFPDTPVTMLKDVFEALQLYDLLELLEMKWIKPHRSLQLAYTLDKIKKLNGVADLPTTYHSCGAVLIITDDENVSSASAIKTLFTDLDNESDVTEILIQDIPTFRHLNEEINVMILEIGNLLERETEEQTKKTLTLYFWGLKNALYELKERIMGGGGVQDVFLRLMQSMSGIVSFVRMKLRLVTDELKSFLQSAIVTAERIQANLTKLIQTPEWFVIEDEKEKKNFQENVSAVINGWIHRHG